MVLPLLQHAIVLDLHAQKSCGCAALLLIAAVTLLYNTSTAFAVCSWAAVAYAVVELTRT